MRIQCLLNVRGLGPAFQERPHWCRAGKDWHADRTCVSPIVKPSQECKPAELSGMYFQKVSETLSKAAILSFQL